MADLKISELALESSLTGTEDVEIVTGGINKRTTTQDIADLGGGGGHVIENEGTPLTQRADLNFVGGGVSVADTGGKTVVTIPDKFPAVYNVVDHGLVGDGSTDNSAALTSLVGSLSAGSTLYFPSGNFQFTTTVTIDKQINIVGDGWTSIIGTDQNNITIIEYDDGGTPITDIQINNIKFVCDAVSTPVFPSSALHLNTVIRFKVENVFVGGFYTNVTLTNPVAYVFDFFYCNGWVEAGLDMRSSGAFVDAGDGSIINSYFVPTVHQCDYSIYHENGGGLKIANCKFNYDASPLTRTQYHYYYEGTGATVDLNISNNSFENFTVAAIRMGVSGAGSFEEVAINGNDIGAGTGTTGIDGIIISNIDNGNITGNTFLSIVGGTDNAITLTNCDNWVIHNQYTGWTENLSATGNNILVPVSTDGTVPLLDDNFLQRKSGLWEQRTPAQVAADLTTLAPKASPALTGTPTAPTAAPGTNTTQIATTAFVDAAVSGATGVDEFIELTDAPASFTGASLQFVRVNVGETALEFATPAGGGDVVGPASAADGMTAVFDGTSGTLLKESPAWVDWSANVNPTGFSATTTETSYYHDDGRSITIWIKIEGTSNATTFTVQLPVAANANYGSGGLMAIALVANHANNGVGRVYCSGSSTTMTVERDVNGTAFQASGSKGLNVSFTYMK